MEINKEKFGFINGNDVYLYSLVNNNNAKVQVTNYGGYIVSIIVPDRNGNFDDVVLGHSTFKGYLGHKGYLGCVVGRYANRIANGTFNLENVEYKLAVNNNTNHLHGGIKGFNSKIWNAILIENSDSVGIELSYKSPDGEEGYPGTLECLMRYIWTNDNELVIEYHATTDKPTIINLTNHSYFNLSGRDDILDHYIKINADFFTPVNPSLIPTGVLQPVHDTPLDFRKSIKIGERINQDYDQLNIANGYDHNWVLNNYDGSFRKCCEAFDNETGRLLELFTTEPGVQFYTGNFLDGTITGKKGKIYQKRSGFCFETQHYPDSPNQPEFPTTTLLPGQKYFQKTSFKFSIR